MYSCFFVWKEGSYWWGCGNWIAEVWNFGFLMCNCSDCGTWKGELLEDMFMNVWGSTIGVTNIEEENLKQCLILDQVKEGP